MMEAEQLASAYEPNLGKATVQRKTWDDFAGKADRLRVVPWYKVMAASKANTPAYYSSSIVAGLGGMISTPSEIPTDGEVGTPLVKTTTGVGFERLKLLE